MKKVPTYDLRLLPEEINKIPKFYTIFARKMPDYIIRQQDRGQVDAKCLRPRPKLRGRGRGQIFEAEAETKILVSGLEDLSLFKTSCVFVRLRDWLL